MPPILQKITVPYEYPVYFTVDVFAPRNPALVEALARKEPSRRHRLFVVVERAVAEAWPGLATAVARYVERHADRLELVAPPVGRGGRGGGQERPGRRSAPCRSGCTRSAWTASRSS